MLSTVTGPAIYAAAIIFGMGVCYFWPTMLGFVNTNLPKTGAIGLNTDGWRGHVPRPFRFTSSIMGKTL